MREMRGEVGKQTHKKEMENPSFLSRHRNQKWCKSGTDWDSSEFSTILDISLSFTNILNKGLSTRYF